VFSCRQRKIHTHTHARTRTHTHTYTRIHTRTHTDKHEHTQTHTHTRTYTHTHTHTSTHAHVHTRAPLQRTHVHIHALTPPTLFSVATHRFKFKLYAFRAWVKTAMPWRVFTAVRRTRKVWHDANSEKIPSPWIPSGFPQLCPLRLFWS